MARKKKRKLFNGKIFKSSFVVVLVLFIVFLSLAIWQYGWQESKRMIIGYGVGITGVTLVAMAIVGRKKIFKWFN